MANEKSTQVSSSLTWRPESGREPFVYQAKTPGELFGVHAGLMEKTLSPEENLLYLLYSPMYEAQGGHFGIRAFPASHALAVTNRRLVVTSNRHLKAVAPEVHSIPHGSVLTLEIGSALLMGWLSIRFVSETGPGCVTLIFNAAGGWEHFHAAVRTYRRASGCDRVAQGGETVPWWQVQARTPPALARSLRLLVPETEPCLGWIGSSEMWGIRKRGWKKISYCLRTNGILVAGSHGLVYIHEEPPLRRELTNFAFNALCIPLEALRSADLVENLESGNRLLCLEFQLGRGSHETCVQAFLDESDMESGKRLSCVLNRHSGSG